MATEKYFCFDEQGELKRIKGRLVRFLDNEAPTGSDKSAIRTSLEVSPDAEGLVQADVGTAPNEIPVNGMLGDLAFQDADSVAMGTVEAESLEVTDKITTKDVGGVSKGQVEFQDSSYTISGGSYLGDIRQDAPRHRFFSGSTILAQIDQTTSYFQNTSLGIGTSSPGSLSAAANNLVVGSGTGNQGLTVFSGSANEAAIYFADGTAGNQAYRGYVVYQNASDSLVFGSSGTTRWSIDSSGNLVANSTGIDFGSGASTTISDYEEGTWTPVYAPQTGSFTTMTMNVSSARYTKVGNMVHIRAYIRTDAVNLTGGTGKLHISGLPFTATGDYSSLNAGYCNYFANNPAGAYVNANSTTLVLTKRNTGITGSLLECVVSDLSTASGTNNAVMIDGAYETTA